MKYTVLDRYPAPKILILEDLQVKSLFSKFDIEQYNNLRY